MKKYLSGVESENLGVDRYSEIDNTMWHDVVKLFEEGKIV